LNKNSEKIFLSEEEIRSFIHSLRNNAATLSAAFSNIRRKSGEAENYQRHFKSISRKLSDTERLILNLSVCSLGVHPVLQSEPAGELLEQLVSASLKTYSREGVSLRVTGSVREGSLINCDRTLIGALIDNLIKNAFEALPSENGSLMISSGVRDEETLFLNISDNGPGYSDSAACGAGLGLRASRLIALSHKGELTLKSLPVSGTRAELRLPLSGKASV